MGLTLPTHIPGPLFVMGAPILPLFAGNAFFVDSNNGANNTSVGKSWDQPFASIAYAISQCRAGRNDIILVSPRHTETISAAAGINFNLAGVTVLGLGSGAARPTLTLSAVASTIAFNAASAWFENFIVRVTEDCTIVADVNAADCTIKNCDFRFTTGKEWVTCIDINGGSANACDRTRILDCIFRSPVAGADNAIGLDEVADGVEIRRCKVWGDFNDACIHNPTGKVLTNLTIAECELTNLQSGDHSIELVSACTGMLIRNLYHNNMTQATGVDPGSCFSFECYHDDVVDTSGILCPVVT